MPRRLGYGVTVVALLWSGASLACDETLPPGALPTSLLNLADGASFHLCLAEGATLPLDLGDLTMPAASLTIEALGSTPIALPTVRVPFGAKLTLDGGSHAALYVGRDHQLVVEGELDAMGVALTSRPLHEGADYAVEVLGGTLWWRDGADLPGGLSADQQPAPLVKASLAAQVTVERGRFAGYAPLVHAYGADVALDAVVAGGCRALETCPDASASYLLVDGSDHPALLHIVGSVLRDHRLRRVLELDDWGEVLGAAVHLRGDVDASIRSSAFLRNRARLGGAIGALARGADTDPMSDDIAPVVAIETSWFVDNEAVYAGGAIYGGRGAQLELETSQFLRNSAGVTGTPTNGEPRVSSHGGAVALALPTPGDWSDVGFRCNTAGGDGGALRLVLAMGQMTLHSVRVDDRGCDTTQDSAARGGALSLTLGVGPLPTTVRLLEPTIVGARASEGGGAIDASVAASTTLIIDQGLISGNRVSAMDDASDNGGGALRVEGKGTVEVHGTAFADNQAMIGGAIDATTLTGTLQASASRWLNNVAISGEGHAIASSAPDFSIYQGAFCADLDGGSLVWLHARQGLPWAAALDDVVALAPLNPNPVALLGGPSQTNESDHGPVTVVSRINLIGVLPDWRGGQSAPMPMSYTTATSSPAWSYSWLPNGFVGERVPIHTSPDTLPASGVYTSAFWLPGRCSLLLDANALDAQCSGPVGTPSFNCAEQEGDLFGRPVDFDGDGVPVLLDCDDGAADIGPTVTAVSCARDHDCDGYPDPGSGGLLVPDIDGDDVGHALSGSSVGAFSCPEQGLVVRSDDCDDEDPTVSPDAIERCDNGVDDDCDGMIDEGCEAEDTDTGEPTRGGTILAVRGGGCTCDSGAPAGGAWPALWLLAAVIGGRRRHATMTT